MGLAFLVKGPMGVLWPLASVLLWLAFCGRWSERRRLWSGPAFALFALLAVPWPVAMTLRHDDFLWYTVVHEQIYRVLGKRMPNEALFPTSTFLLLSVGHFFPWILNLPQALVAGVRRLRAGPAPGLVLGLVWSGFPLVFFSLSRSKGDYYALQIFPGWCLLVAWLWNEALERRVALRWLGAPWLVTGILALGVLAADRLGLWVLPSSPGDFADHFVPVAAVGGLAIGGAAALGRQRLALAGIAVYMTIFFALFQGMYEERARDESMHFAAVAYRAEAPAGARIVSDERPEFAHVCSLAFYTDQPAWLVRDAQGSKLHFSFKEYDKRVIDEADLVRWVRQGTPVYAVGDLERWPARFARLGLRGTLRAEQGERGLFRVEEAR
jgi:4-amino-4-deoxy-L-arabinose transferase-like glycosyltransferase